jgi:hypothetical protein
MSANLFCPTFGEEGNRIVTHFFIMAKDIPTFLVKPEILTFSACIKFSWKLG